MKLKLFIISFFLVVLFAASSSAQEVVYVCPEGTVASTVYGKFECKPIGRQTTESDRVAAYGALALIMGDLLAEMRNDPRYKSWVNGEWNFIGGKPNEHCTSIFFRRGVVASLTSTGGKKDLAFFVFMGSDIPKPDQPTKVLATLTQTGEKPATVNVINVSYTATSSSGKSEKWGVIFFGVPSMEAGINGMEETQKFGIAIDGKTVAEIEWNGGLAARNELKQCLDNPSVWAASRNQKIQKTQTLPNVVQNDSPNKRQTAEKFVDLGVQAMKTEITIWR